MSRHLTSEETSRWIIGERTPEAQRHVAECAQCRGEVDHVENAFRQFRDSAQGWSEHWYAARNIRRTGAVWFWRRLAVSGLLLSLTLAAALVVMRPAHPRHEEEPFLPIPYVAALAPYEQTTVMRMEVPVTALIAAGFEVHAPDAGGALTVDVLVGQDGRAHALRPAYRSEKFYRSVKQ